MSEHDRRINKLRKRLSKLRKGVEKKLPVGGVTPENRKKAAKLTERGRQEYNAGLYDLAADFFEKALKLDPRNQKTLYSLGNTYYKQKEGEKAVAKWRRCIDVNPQNAIASKARKKLQHVAKAGAALQEQLHQLEEDIS